MTVLSLPPLYCSTPMQSWYKLFTNLSKVITRILITGYVYGAITGGFIFVNRLSLFQFSSLPKPKRYSAYLEASRKEQVCLSGLNIGKERDLTKD